MVFLERILGWPSRPHNDHIPSTLTFLQLDTETIKKRLRLAEEAGRRATVQGPDDMDEKIVGVIESAKTKAYEKFSSERKTFNERIHSLAFRIKCHEIIAAAHTAHGNFLARIRSGKDTLQLLRENVVRSERHLERFRKENRLDRPAHYPRSRTLRWGIILLVVLVETALNGNFLALGHELGRLGGTVEALAIAMVNVGLGLFFGWKVARLMNHRNAGIKMVGGLGTAAYVAAVPALNLLVAHYRDALTGRLPEGAGERALHAALADPLGVASVQSWFLFALGCVFSLVAFVDGMGMDDAYPRYGALDRKRAENISNYVEQKEVLMSELEQVRDNALRQMEGSQKDLDARYTVYQTILASRENLSRSFAQHLNHLEQSANELLAYYRHEKNEAAGRAPEHGAPRWTLERPKDWDADLGEEQVNPEREIATVFKELEEYSRKLHADYETAIIEYRNVEELTLKDLSDGKVRT